MSEDSNSSSSSKSDGTNIIHFRSFCDLCKKVREVSSHKQKSELLNSFISDSKLSNDDLFLLLILLLPKESKRVYNLKDKQLINLFSELFEEDKDKMLEDLQDSEDAAIVIGKYFSKNDILKPKPKSFLNIKEVDAFLTKLAQLFKDTDRLPLIKSIMKKCTVNDLIMIVRLIRQDLRINAGTKQILDGLHPKAYALFQTSRDLKIVIAKVIGADSSNQAIQPKSKSLNSKKPTLIRSISISMRLMTPVKPMLAEACRSVVQALAKASPDEGLLAEIKYDGERVQVHKKGNEFSFFSRSLKQVQPNKVVHLKSYIPQAFQAADELVIDAEVLLMDTKTNKPLPFGTLGIHKRNAFKDATVCLFVFDCLFLNGQSLINRPISERRKILEQNISEIQHHIHLSEKHIIRDCEALNILMARVFEDGLEGLVLKSMDSIYEPGKRHWLKIKKDYLAEGAMADTVDLIVLGAYSGTGNKAGMMSVFLMGCYDESTKKFCTVTKCGNGFTDEMLTRLQKEIKVAKINKSNPQVPTWLNVSKSLIPDFVVSDPKASPVWEITGAEFSRASTHTAGQVGNETQGISIRFPRLTKERKDKTWKEATTVSELEKLVETSGRRTDWLDVLTSNSSSVTPNKKRKTVNESDSEYQSQPNKKIKHLSSKLSSLVFELEASLFHMSNFDQLLRTLISHGAQFTGPTDKIPTLFLNSKDEPTHLLVPDNYDKDSDLPQITISQIKSMLQC